MQTESLMHVLTDDSKPALMSGLVKLCHQVLTNDPERSNMMFPLDLEVKSCLVLVSGSVTKSRPVAVVPMDPLTSLSPQVLCHRSQGGNVRWLVHHDSHPGFLAQSIDVCRVVTRNRVAESRASH